MSQAFGYNGVFGWAREVTPGTRVAPTKFLEIIPGSFKGGLAQTSMGKPVQNSTRTRYYTKSKIDIAPAFEFYMPFQGAEELLLGITGGSVGSALISDGVYRHTFALGDSLPSYSVYYSPDFSALAKLHSYNGCLMKSLTFTQAEEEFLKVNPEFLGMNETIPTSAASASYPTFKGVDYEMLGTLTIGGSSYKIISAEVKIENPLAEDGYKLGSRNRVVMGRSGVRKVSGKFSAYLDDFAIYQLFSNLTEVALSFIWTGPIAAAAVPYRMSLDIARAIMQGSPPTIDGHGPVKIELPFEAYYDGTNDELVLKLDNLLTSVS